MKKDTPSPPPRPPARPFDADAFYASFAKSLRTNRESRRLTRDALVALLPPLSEDPSQGVQRLYKYETCRARPPLHVAWLLARAMRYSLDGLCAAASEPRTTLLTIAVELPDGQVTSAIEAIRRLAP